MMFDAARTGRRISITWLSKPMGFLAIAIKPRRIMTGKILPIKVIIAILKDLKMRNKKRKTEKKAIGT